VKVNAYGLFIDSDRTPFQTLELGLAMNEIGYNYSIKFGNPVTYLKTYDRISCATGGSWARSASACPVGRSTSARVPLGRPGFHLF
jgi:hypothetical protein